MCLLPLQVVTEKNADLLKIMAMRGNGLGSILVGGPRPEMGRGRPNPDGFLIPEAFKERLSRFDKNNDGRLSTQEVEAMPEPARERIKNALGMGGVNED